MLYLPLLCFVITYICEKMHFQVHLNIYIMIFLYLHVCEKTMYLNMCDLKDDSAFGGYYKVMYLHQGNKESLTSWVV